MYQVYLTWSGKVAALSSLLFVGVALLVSKYNWASFLQFVLVPVVYALPQPQNKPGALLACVALNICFYAIAMGAGERLGLGTDVLGGTLSLISISLAADAAIHDAVASMRSSEVSASGKTKKVISDTLEVRPKYMLF